MTLLPYRWQFESLGSLSATARNSIVDPSKFPDEEFEYYSIPAFQTFGRPAIESGRKILSAKLAVENETVLFGKLNPRVLKVWLVRSESRNRKIATTEFIPLRPKNHVSPDYLYFLCHSEIVTAEAGRLVSGSTPSRERVDPTAFRDVLVPVPPLAEQRAIASVLRAVQDARDARRRELELERERKAALMDELFTHGTRGDELKETEVGWMPTSWDCRPLGQLVDAVSGGTPSKQRDDWWAGDIPWVSPKDMKRPRLYDVQNHITHEAASNGSRIVPAGTVFIVIRGMILAKDVPVALAMVPMAFNQDMKAFLPRESIRAEYLLYVLSHRKYEIERLIGTSAHGTKRLGTDQLNDLMIPVPPIDEQKAIGDTLSACDEKLSAVVAESSLLDELFRSVLEQLMSGQVQVNTTGK